MTLLQKLVECIKDCKPIDGAKTVHFVFEGADIAFVTEVDMEWLVPALRKWCNEYKVTVH